ncbi:response regulator transcription factor [Maribacter algicola]|uniref:Response regulator transcription factor n=1 Tax=Meishania litoralis TaxID=3434685 RepID=A0ACC7LKR9_9FLAO
MGVKKVLLAEDDELLAALLRHKLTKVGYMVDLCKDGKEVKEYLQTTRPDIIVTDIMMPYFSGIELIDFIRNEMNSNLPIIIISSAGNEENVLTAFEMGANDFISKPISPAELIVRIERELIKNKFASS